MNEDEHAEVIDIYILDSHGVLTVPGTIGRSCPRSIEISTFD